MRCPSCQTSYHAREDEWESAGILDGRIEAAEFAWVCFLTLCPKCKGLNILLQYRSSIGEDVYSEDVIYPASTGPSGVGPGVPDNLKEEYLEAVRVLDVSAKASAMLSRRILQTILFEQGYKSRNLDDQISAVLKETDPDKVLPQAIRQTVDAIRNFGNFSAHQQKDKVTSEIIDVEPQEAEWCLEIVSDLFEHYYVRPTANAKKLADLNHKLQQAGKPPAK